jgi:TolB-like protein
MSFLAEIKRRKVFQVAAVYVVVAWLLIQVADVVLPTFEAPTWVLKVVIFLTILGFPITLTMSWAFNFTPDGFVKDQGPNVTGRTSGRRIEYVLIGLMVIGLGWLVYRVEFDAPISADNPPMPAARVAEERSVAALEDVLPNSIAVLPFTNLSPDPDNAYFAAGIYQSTLNQLGQFSDLFVIASASVMQYANDPPPIPEIAKALNVEVVMTGSVRYADGRVLITAQLIEGRTGRQIWSKEYRRELTDVFAVQGEVAEQIAMAMQVQLIPEERARIEKRPTESEKAYQHYLYALSLSNWAVAPEIWDAYTQSLERAIVEDPDFAEAYALLSYTYAVRGDTDIAIRYANKAIELEPTVATAYRTLGDIDADYFARQDR